MALNINTNTYSQAVQRNMSSSQSGLMTSMQRLSSGSRINSAADDAAGLAISDRMNSLIKSQNVALRNVNDATSMMQVADGAAGDISTSLARMKELATQASNGTLQTSDRTALQTEFNNLQKEITRTAAGASFNGTNVLNNSSGTATIQIGSTASDTLSISTANLQASATGMAVGSSSISISSQSNASSALTAIDSAIDKLNSTRSDFGANMNRLSSISAQLSTSIQNQSAAKSRITDTDYATETASLSRTQVLQQAGMAMLSQANSLPQQVLSLLR
jgi:flagellin